MVTEVQEILAEHSEDEILSPATGDGKPVLSSTTADYEELHDIISPPLVRSVTMDTKVSSRRQPAVENEYVPSPENSPKFGIQRQRANTTVAIPSYNNSSTVANINNNPDHTQCHTHYSKGGVASHEFQQPMMDQHQYQPRVLLEEQDSPGHLKHKHLSVVSMESGLSFGYDVEKDFNPSQPLEAQPWFHGKLPRGDAEALLHDDGDFLVRENISMAATYTLTLRWRGVADHTLIGTTEVISTTSLARGLAVKYQFDSGAFDSIPELIYNHLKYQIPVDKAQHTLIINPICRGNASKPTSMGMFTPALSRSNGSPESSPATLSSHSGTSLGHNRRSGSPLEALRQQQQQHQQQHLIRLGRPIHLNESLSASNVVYRTMPATTLRENGKRLSKHLSNSSGDLLEASKDEVEVSLRNVISPPPDTRGRSMTMAAVRPASARVHRVSPTYQQHQQLPNTTNTNTTNAANTGASENDHQRTDSFGDYEVMESVSILSESPSLGSRRASPQPQQQPQQYHQQHQQQHTPPQQLRAQSLSTGNSLNRRERVKYAEIRYPNSRSKEGSPIMSGSGVGGTPGVLIRSNTNTVNYAEVRFTRSSTIDGSSSSSLSRQQPHPFSLYDTVPPGRRDATPPAAAAAGEERPYQSRADLLAQRLQGSGEPTYAIPTSAKKGSPHKQKQVSNYATIHFPNTSSSSSSTSTSSGPRPSGDGSNLPPPQTDSVLYALLNKTSLTPKSRETSASNDSLPSGGASSTHSNSPGPKHVIGSSLIHSHTPSAKVHRSLPGYEALVKVHTILQNHSNDELAYHMTRADAMSFMLAPRPGEDRSVWKER